MKTKEDKTGSNFHNEFCIRYLEVLRFDKLIQVFNNFYLAKLSKISKLSI